MTAIGHKARLWYVVAPVAGQWQVTFGCDSKPVLYATQEEAQLVARSAARLHWENRQNPTGARLDLPGETRQVLCTFGRMVQAEPVRMAR